MARSDAPAPPGTVCRAVPHRRAQDARGRPAPRVAPACTRLPSLRCKRDARGWESTVQWLGPQSHMQSIPSFGSSNGSTARHAASSTGLWEMQQPKRRPAKLWCCTRRAGPALHVGKLGTAVADAACCVSIVKCSLVPPPLVITENSPACPKRKQTKRHVELHW